MKITKSGPKVRLPFGTATSGDVSGGLPGDLTVVGIGGIPVDVSSPTDGDVLTYVLANADIELLPSSGGGATFGTPAIVLGTAAAAGAIDEVIRRDSTIVAFDATAPVTQAFADVAATGAAAIAARRDHKHGMPTSPLGLPLGLTGATAATRYVGATASGAPASGTFAVGDFIIDQSGKVWVCTVAGTPGTWVQISSGITVVDEGTPLATAGTTLDFVGAGVTATGAGATKTITVPNSVSGTSYQIVAVYDASTSAIAGNPEVDVVVPAAGTLVSWTLLADVSGSITIDIYKAAYASYPPSSSIVNTGSGGVKPALSSQSKNQDLTLLHWTTALAAGDVLRFHVDSTATVKRVELTLTYTRT